MRLGNAAVRVLAGLSIGVLAVGCSSSSTTSQSSSASSPAAAGDNSNASGGTPIKIGIEFPLSGGDASNGIPSDNGAKLAIQEANKAGVPGGSPLSPTTSTTPSRARTTRRKVRRTPRRSSRIPRCWR